MKVAIVAEFYPRRSDPVLGVWAHRQALAARDAGADVRVLVLHRLVPPRAALREGPASVMRAWLALAGEPHHQIHDDLDVTYVRYFSPARGGSYHAWGAWAAGPLALALRKLRRSFPFEIVHAHNAIPAADAVRRARVHVPLVVSVHGGDVLYTAPRSDAGRRAVHRGLAAASTVLANSGDIAELARTYGARETRVVHLGATLATAPPIAVEAAATGTATTRARAPESPSIVTVGHLVARKRHADVLRALAVLGPRHPSLRYVIIGDGPERAALAALAERLGASERLELCGQLPPAQALERMRRCTLFAMPSTEEAFGVAYIEAMAAGLPAIGCRGEPGPEEIAAAGGGMVLVPPGDIERLVQRIDELLSDPTLMRETSRRARATVAANFTWERCGEQTLAAYEHVLAAGRPSTRHMPGAPRMTPTASTRDGDRRKPVLFVTGHAPAYRVGAFACLSTREQVEFALFGGRSKHGGAQAEAELPFPHRRVREHELYALAASGRYRAIVCSTAGRVALPAAWAGARRARVPLLLWASLWAHPRTPAHLASFFALRRLYRSADAVVAYGPHVRSYVQAHGARNVHLAPQSVDNAFWGSPEVAAPASPSWPAEVEVKFLFAGRAAREKGLGVLGEAWTSSGLRAPTAALVLVGVGSTPPWVPAGGAVCPQTDAAGPPTPPAGIVPVGSEGSRSAGGSVICLQPVPPLELRNLYAAADVLVLPSIPTRTFREPWGLVVNEAMNRELAVIATDAVGAAAGGLVRDGRNGLVVPAGDAVALAGAMHRLAQDSELRARMGRAGREDVQAYTHETWAEGFSRALASLDLSHALAGVEVSHTRGSVDHTRGSVDVSREHW